MMKVHHTQNREIVIVLRESDAVALLKYFTYNEKSGVYFQFKKFLEEFIDYCCGWDK